MQATCAELGADLPAVNGVTDHVHLLVSLPATLALADLVKRLKSASSHLITSDSQPNVFFKWQGPYATYSVSSDAIPTVRDYIMRQKVHHAAQTLILDWEYTPPAS